MENNFWKTFFGKFFLENIFFDLFFLFFSLFPFTLSSQIRSAAAAIMFVFGTDTARDRRGLFTSLSTGDYIHHVSTLPGGAQLLKILEDENRDEIIQEMEFVVSYLR